MEIKAIETIYDEYKFRSRLEARWAVFFNAMGIEYEYEKEGYDLGKDGWYLPDFWLPELELWVEIKPQVIGITASQRDEAHDKAEALRDIANYPVLLCYGSPKQTWNYLYACDTNDSGGGNYEGYATFGERYLIVLDHSSSRSFFTADWKSLNNIKSIFEVNKIYGEDIGSKEFNQFIENGIGRSWEAARMARKARFEHGECG